jgi:hypothetical protein
MVFGANTYRAHAVRPAVRAHGDGEVVVGGGSGDHALPNVGVGGMVDDVAGCPTRWGGQDTEPVSVDLEFDERRHSAQASRSAAVPKLSWEVKAPVRFLRRA